MIAPRATYRLQLEPRFTFADAVRVVPYIAGLGVSHLYLSPILQAAEGSTHGYDVVDPAQISTEIGGEDGFRALVAAAKAHGLGILLDIVPNHMSITGTRNAWWMDVLANGPASYYAHYFDVDWEAGNDRVTLPVLGERYGRALANGTLGVVFETGFAVKVGDARYPIAPESLGTIIRRAGERARSAELQFVGDALAALPRETLPESRRRRHRDKLVLAQRLAVLVPEHRAAIDAELAALNADIVELDAILEAQAYRLAHWSVASHRLPYRRFFDITTLVGLRVDELDVFEARHARVFEWLADGSIDGVRIDHVDGLADPGEYLQRLRDRAPDAWIVVEKILGTDEALPAWPVDGTTGYEFADVVTSLLVSPAGEAELTAEFEDYTGTPWAPAADRRRARIEVAREALHSEIARLVSIATHVCAQTAVTRDFTRPEIEAALIEIVAGYPVYRTYVGTTLLESAPKPAPEVDEHATTGLHIVQAVELTTNGPQTTLTGIAVPVASDQPRANGSGPIVIDPDRDRIATACRAASGDPDLIAFLELALAGEVANARELARVAQQVTGAIVAKGDEDTASYRLVRLAARCEVGADPSVLAIDAATAHARLAAGAPKSLLATSTHDTKRGEDQRARLAVISERAVEWRSFVERLDADRYWGGIAPDRTFEYLFWQTAVGTWPLTPERAHAYATKATREARLRTSWLAPDETYEAAMHAWIDAVLVDPVITGEISEFVDAIAPRAQANSLAQLLLKLTTPGIPDFYQGSELTNYALVDPDNRTPVDYSRAADSLGAAKLHVVQRVLALRRDRPALFEATYSALTAHGPGSERVFAFMRGKDLLVAVPRLGDVNPETLFRVPTGTWRDALTDTTHSDGTIAAAALFATFPVALLVKEPT
ncbi:MAG: alpha-amylase family glycosyl hydrolase [Kofleriaceae bacterium]